MIPVTLSRGEWSDLPAGVLQWVEECVDLCRPRDVHIMDGSAQEAKDLKVGYHLHDQISLILTSRQCW